MVYQAPELGDRFLIEHQAFLRSLARSLVFDDNTADDVVQQACLAALERPPRHAGPLRSWMALVVRNLAFSMLKREGERTSRERVAARPESGEKDEELDLERQQLVLDAVRELGQPYRKTVYLRYYRNLTPTEIAEAEGIPVATVKTRLRRGLEALREVLDRRDPGGRESWCLALAPFAAGANFGPVAGVVVPTTLLKGMILMKKPILAGASVVAFLAIVGVTLVAMRGDSDDSGREPSRPSAIAPPADIAKEAAPVLEPVSAVDAPAGETARTAVATAEPTEANVATTSRIMGRVVDDRGNAVVNAEVALLPAGGALFSFLSMEAAPTSHGVTDLATATDEKGRFMFPLDDSGGYHLAIGADGFAPYRKETVATAGEDNDVGDLALDPGVILSGRVIDSAGRPIADAELRQPISAGNGAVIVLQGTHARPVLAITNALGEFSIRRQAVGPWELRVTAEDHPAADISGQTRQAGERASGLVITLEDGFEIRGRLTAIPSDASDSLQVSASPQLEPAGVLADFTAFQSTMAEVEPDGTFRVRGLAGGTEYRLRAVASGGFLNRRTRSDSVTAQPGDTDVLLSYRTPSTIVFQVVDGETNDPLTEFQVEAGADFLTALSEDGSLIGNPRTHHPGGYVRFEDVEQAVLAGDGRTRVRVTAVGYETYEHTDIDLADGEEVSLGVVRMKPVPIVTVTVMDERSGVPVEGAVVSLLPQSDAAGGFGGPMRRIGVRMQSGGEGPVVSTEGDDPKWGTTDEHGVCVLTSLPGQDVRLSVRADGHAPSVGETMTLPSGDYEERVRLAEGSTVEVHVADAEGASLAGQTVQHRAPSNPTAGEPFGGGHGAAESVTDSEGRVFFHNLEPGTHRFRLSEDPFSGGGVAGGPRMHFAGVGSEDTGAPWADVDVVSGETETLYLTASPRGSLSGVVTEGGLALAGADVQLLPPDDGPGPQVGGTARLPGMDSGGPSTKTDSRGRYAFEDLPVGDYRLSIGHASRHMPWKAPVELEVGVNDRDVDLDVTIIEGRVTDEEGEPVAGVRVAAERSTSSGGQQVRMIAITVGGNGDGAAAVSFGGEESPEVYTDEDGFYELRGVAADTPLVVKATSTDFAPTQSDPVELLPGDRRIGVDLVASPAGQIELLLTRPDGSAAGGYLATARWIGDPDRQVDPITGFVGPNGSATLTGCRVGSWRVNLSPIGMGGAPTAAAPDPREVEVAAGETETLEFTVEP